MKILFHFTYLLAFFTIKSFCQEEDLNKILREQAKLQRGLKIVEVRIKNFTILQDELYKQKLILQKELDSTVSEIEEETMRSELFGLLNEESGVKFIRSFKDFIDKSQKSFHILSDMRNKTFNSEILHQNIDNRIKNIQRIIGKINTLDSQYKSKRLNKLIYMIREANYLKRKYKEIEDKLELEENEAKKSSISTSSLKEKKFFNTAYGKTLEPKCVNRDSCRLCLQDPNCVWCDLDKQCKFGDKNGPYDGSCLNKYSYSYCNKSCFTYSTCTSCINDENCGWCGGLHKCVEGGFRGSIGFICENGYIHREAQGRCSNHYLNNAYSSNTKNNNFK